MTWASYSQGNGKFSNGVAFDGSSVTATAPLDGTSETAFTTEAWVQPSANSTGGQVGLFEWTTTYWNAPTDSSPFMAWAQDSSGYYLGFYVDGAIRQWTWATPGYWAHLVVTCSASHLYTFYVNGAAIGTYQGSSSPANQWKASEVYFGTGYNGMYTGSMQEFRLSSVARSGAWIATEYANQNSPSTFYTVGSTTPTWIVGQEQFFWAADGKMLMSYTSWLKPNVGVQYILNYRNVYFGGRLISTQGGALLTDRTGSNVGGGKRYYPYGQERPSATANNTVKFGTYYRDAETGNDYADQRYYGVGTSRFKSPDAFAGSARPADPGTWNRYTYGGSDPINRIDPSGNDFCDIYGFCVTDFECQIYGIDPFTCSPANYVPTGGAFAYDASAGGASYLQLSSAAPSPLGPPAPPPNSDCVGDAISSAAVAIVLDLSSFTLTGVQIAGTPDGNGGVYAETELNFSGAFWFVEWLQDQMCGMSFATNLSCPGGGGNDSLVGNPHPGYQGNFRSPGLTNSVQVNTSVSSRMIQIDIDPFNPSDGLLGTMLHLFAQVVPNQLNGTDNTYGCPN